MSEFEKNMRILRALYYERVSTANEDQTSSMENQRLLCENYLAKHKEIMLMEPLDTYSERISGKSDCREKFSKMMLRIQEGDIDLILVKDLKRLSRSTEVSAMLRKICKEYHVKLLLLDKGQLYDPNDDQTRMFYGFESLINEEVVFRQSQYGKIAHKQKMAALRLNAQNCTFVHKWDKNKGDLYVDEDKAQIICRVFELYVFKGLGGMEIRRYLKRNYNMEISVNTIMNWLQETAFIGVFHMNKKGSELGVGVGQKTKRFMNPKDQWVAVERPDLAFLDKRLFELANRIHQSRQNLYGNTQKGYKQTRFAGTHLYSGKIFCAECGCSYIHYWSGRKTPVSSYKDSCYLKRGSSDACENKKYSRISEDQLNDVVLTAINSFIQENKDCFSVLESVLERTLDKKNNEALKKIENELKKIVKDKEKTQAAFIDASGTLRRDLADKYENLSQRESELKSKLEAYSNNDSADLMDRISDIKQKLKNLSKIEKVNRVILNNFVDKILIYKDGTIKVILNTAVMPTYSYDFTQRQEQTSSERSAFLMLQSVESIICFYNEKFYEDVVKMLNEGSLFEHHYNLVLDFFEYRLSIKQKNVIKRSVSQFLSKKEVDIKIIVSIVI